MRNRKINLGLLAAGAAAVITLTFACGQRQGESEHNAIETDGNTQSIETSRGTYTGQPGKDSVYIKMVALTDLKETAVGKLAMQKRPGTPTAAFGEMLVQDHSKSTAELGRFAAKGGLALPAEMDDKGKSEKAGLESLEGAAFDREFARMMVEGHNKAIALMKEIAADASDAELKAWASGKIPVLESHLGHALALQKEPGQK